MGCRHARLRSLSAGTCRASARAIGPRVGASVRHSDSAGTRSPSMRSSPSRGTHELPRAPARTFWISHRCSTDAAVRFRDRSATSRCGPNHNPMPDLFARSPRRSRSPPMTVRTPQGTRRRCASLRCARVRDLARATYASAPGPRSISDTGRGAEASARGGVLGRSCMYADSKSDHCADRGDAHVS